MLLVLLGAGLLAALAVLLHHHLSSGPPSEQASSPTPAASSLDQLPLSPRFLRNAQRQAQIQQLITQAKTAADPTDSLRQLASLLYGADEPAAARQVLEQMPRQSGVDGTDLELAGLCEMRLGHLERAEALFRQQVELQPDSWTAPHHLGQVLARQRRWAEAETSFSTAIERGGSASWPLLDLGLMRLRLEQPAAALELFDRAAALDSRHPPLQLYRMLALEAQGEQVRADQAHQEFMKTFTSGMSDQPLQLREPLAPAEADAGGLRFTDAAPALGLATPARSLAAAWADLDGDGQLDLLVGHPEEVSDLRLNRGPGQSFTEGNTGLGFFDNASAFAVEDLDRDGRLDLYVVRGGLLAGRRMAEANLLLLGTAERTFRDATPGSGAGDPGAGAGVVVADFDRDGQLDLFVVNESDTGRLLHNQGKARFEDVTEPAGITELGPASSAVAADLDDDGDTDLFVAINGGDNLLYRNDTAPAGPLRFTELGFAARVALSGGSGCTVADFDNDGRLDLFVASASDWNGGGDFEPGDPSYLFLNQGGMTFRESGWAAGLRYVGGALAPAAADLDADGWVDLYLGTGGPEPRREEPDLLYRNLGPQPGGGVRFAEVSRAAGIDRPGLAGHSVAVADFDRDGDLDLYVASSAALAGSPRPDVLWLNESAHGHWLAVSLVGKSGHPSALGARVTLEAGSLRRTEEVGSGSSGTGGQRPRELYFGLGPAGRVDRLTVRWPGGGTSEVRDLPIDRRITLTEGRDGFEPSREPGQ